MDGPSAHFNLHPEHATIASVRILYLTDRLSVRGGADLHLLQVVTAAVAAGGRVTVAYGRAADDAVVPEGSAGVRIRGLASAVASGSRLAGLDRLLHDHDLVHVQNVMNPTALAAAVATGAAVVTVQDHRVFCPATGKTLPGGRPCRTVMCEAACTECLPEPGYRRRTLELTATRRDALRGARLLVLSRYMAEELAAVGLPGAEVLPPWVEPGRHSPEAGSGFVLGGRLVSHKGTLDAWQAWRLAATDHPLRVAGSGPLGDQLEGAERLGWLTPSALRRLLRNARALLFPSRWQEPFGILAVEALAEGTPVVVADSGGTLEWSDAGCLRVPPADPAAMAAAMVRLGDDRTFATRLGDQGRSEVARRFARAPIESRLREVYGEIA